MRTTLNQSDMKKTYTQDTFKLLDHSRDPYSVVKDAAMKDTPTMVLMPGLKPRFWSFKEPSRGLSTLSPPHKAVTAAELT